MHVRTTTTRTLCFTRTHGSRATAVLGIHIGMNAGLSGVTGQSRSSGFPAQTTGDFFTVRRDGHQH